MTKAKESTPKNILLGYGVVKIDGQPIGLTRGGSTFTIEREVRDIEADGDRGPVKGRIVIDKETPILKVNALELFSKDDLMKYYSSLISIENGIESGISFKDSDYHKVQWEGKTLDGVKVIITLPNALNKENLELTLEDKNEVVPELSFTGVYEEDKRDLSAFSIVFVEVQEVKK